MRLRNSAKEQRMININRWIARTIGLITLIMAGVQVYQDFAGIADSWIVPPRFTNQLTALFIAYPILPLIGYVATLINEEIGLFILTFGFCYAFAVEPRYITEPLFLFTYIPSLLNYSYAWVNDISTIDIDFKSKH